MSPGLARLAVMGAALLFSTGGAAIKVEAFSVAQVSCVRSGLAALVLLLWARGRTTWSAPTVWIGIAYASTLTLFVAATKLTTAANAIFIQSTAPLYILILGPLLLGEHRRRRDLVYVASLGAGLAICFAGRPSASLTAPNPYLGNLLAVACSISWAMTLVGLRWAQQHGREAGVSAATIGNLLACVVALPFAWPFASATAVEWTTLAYLGVVQIGVAYLWLTAAMRELPALEVSLLLLLEPVLNPAWTWLLRGEHPGGWVLVGGALIVATTAVRASLARQPRSL